MSNKLLVMLDASALSASSCALRLHLINVVGLKSKLNFNDLEFGTAFHKFRAIYREEGEAGLAKGLKTAKNYYENTPMAIKDGKSYLTSTFLQKVCFEWAEKYNQDSFETLKVKNEKGIEESLLEVRFAIPYYIDDSLELLLAGTMDEIGKWKGGIYSICDAKTTSVWKEDEYFSAFQLSTQMIFYRWLIKKYGEVYPDSIYAKIDREECGVFIDGVFLKGKETPTVYRRSEVFRFSNETLEEFSLILDTKIRDMISWIKMWQSDRIIPFREGMINNSCETKYGKCVYFHLCNSPDKEAREAIEAYNFKLEFYNPLEFQK